MDGFNLAVSRISSRRTDVGRAQCKSFVHSANTVRIETSEAQLEGILYYPNPYPSIHPLADPIAGEDRPAILQRGGEGCKQLPAATRSPWRRWPCALKRQRYRYQTCAR